MSKSSKEVQVIRRENEERECNAPPPTAPAPAPAPAVTSPAANNNNKRGLVEETLALLHVLRSDYASRNTATRTYSPPWHEVARKMAELGYNFTANKCKEKFDNIFKYQKSLKSFPNAKSIEKKYPISDQLKVPDCHEVSFEPTDPQQEKIASTNLILAVNLQTGKPPNVPQLAVPLSVHFDSCPATTTISMSTASPSESESVGARKRKWENYFGGLMNSVLEKQDDSQKEFLEAVDRWENESLAREETSKVQEMARTKREHDRLIKEQSEAWVKEAAVAFLQRVSEQGKCPRATGNVVEAPSQSSRIMSPMTKTTGTALATTQSTPTLPPLPTTLTAPVTTLTSAASPTRASRTSPVQAESIICKTKKGTGENINPRWPKEEVEALISEMDLENVELSTISWDDVSMRMKRIGYDRSAINCRAKWKTMKRYYRKMKDSNMGKPQDSKRCHYFHLLDELDKNKRLNSKKSVCYLFPGEFLAYGPNQEIEIQRLPEGVVQQGQDLNENENCHHGEDEQDIGKQCGYHVFELG